MIIGGMALLTGQSYRLIPIDKIERPEKYRCVLIIGQAIKEMLLANNAPLNNTFGKTVWSLYTR